MPFTLPPIYSHMAIPTSILQTPAEVIARQRAWFREGHTRDLDFRRQQLRSLRDALKRHEDAVIAALHRDLRKPPVEAYFFDVALTFNEIDTALKHLRQWAAPQRVPTPVILQPGKAYTQPEPYGVVTIIGPWNYPLGLILPATVNALAAGNTVVLKPSEMVPHTVAVLRQLVADALPPEQLAIVEGGVAETQALLAEPVDFIHFTGSPRVGRIVMEAAARHLTPVALELGGKCPAIVDVHTHLDQTARRIAWAKCFNAGQSCVAPDYLLVHRSVKEDLIGRMSQAFVEFLGKDPQQSPDLARIVNRQHHERLSSYLTGDIRHGGQTDPEDLFVAPTIIDVPDPDQHPAMEDEIFGPILPVIAYDELDEAIDFINRRPKPLALYVFSNRSHVQTEVLGRTSAGAVCVNDVMVQIYMTDLPLGGVGMSGIGRYHGKAGFDAFSNLKSVLRRSLLVDPPVRYAPYKLALDLVKPIMRWFS
ncbi:MAG: aldehyde dehydrogenase [Bacteroidia bacterium]